MTVEEIIARAICVSAKMNPDDKLGGWKHWREEAVTLAAELEAAGYVVVPKDATEEMKRAGIAIFWDAPAAKIYRAMIEARPK